VFFLRSFIGTGVELAVKLIRFCLHCGEEFLHVKPGKGAAFVRTKLRNYITGNTVEKTFRAGEPVRLMLRP
jgi:hypothetical protein